MNDRLIELAFRDSESYQIPMTEEGMKKAEMRYHSFIQGWKYHEFYMKTGDVCMKDYRDE